MISLKDQLNAIVNAPIPFGGVVVAAVAVVWGMLQWLYKVRIEKIKDLFTLSRSEIELREATSKIIKNGIISISGHGTGFYPLSTIKFVTPCDVQKDL